MPAVVAVVMTLIALAGCGSSGHHTGSGAASTAPAGGGEASKPAGQIVADAAAALRRAGGYVMHGAISENGKPITLDVIAPGGRSIEFAFSEGGARVQAIITPGGSYLRANRAFWIAHAGARGAALVGRWIHVPPSTTQSLATALGHFAPATLSRCLVEGHGTLSVAGRATVAGRPVVIVKDAGNAPGASPGTLAVASSGPPYPLRATATGPQRPGGRVDVCNDGKGGDTRGTITLSHFGDAPPVRAPSNAIGLGQVNV